MPKKSYGKTRSGVKITDELVERLAAKAEAGYEVDEILRRRRADPRSAPPPRASSRSDSTRSSNRLSSTARRRDNETTSSVISKALRQYLTTG